MYIYNYLLLAGSRYQVYSYGIIYHGTGTVLMYIPYRTVPGTGTRCRFLPGRGGSIGGEESRPFPNSSRDPQTNPMASLAVVLALAPTSAAYCGLPAARSHSSRAAVSRMGLFDGVQKAFGSPAGEKPIPAADRVTPFDRWLGLDASLVEEECVGPSFNIAFGPSLPCTRVSHC